MQARYYTHEQIIQALLQGGSARRAAQILGCQAVTVDRRLKDDEFRKMYAAAKADMLKGATAKLQSGCIDAVQILLDIAQDKDISPQVRVNAASAILQHTVRYTEVIDIASRLDALEAQEREVDE